MITTREIELELAQNFDFPFSIFKPPELCSTPATNPVTITTLKKPQCKEPGFKFSANIKTTNCYTLLGNIKEVSFFL